MKEQGSATEKFLRFGKVSRQLVGVNLICFPLFLPIFTWLYISLHSYMQVLFFPGQYVTILPGLSYFTALLLRFPMVFYLFFLVSLVLSGPFLLSLFHFVLRLYQGKHIWVSELFSGVAKHFKRGVLLGIVSFSVLHLSLWTFFLSFTGYSIYLMAARIISLMLIVFLFLTFPYLALLLLSEDLSISQAFKNARILTRSFFPRSLLVLGITGGLTWLIVYRFPPLSLLLFPTCFLGICIFIQVSIIHPLLETQVFRKPNSV